MWRRIIKNNLSVSELVKKIVLFHHEKHDGSGYPLGIKGDKILFDVSIITISDFYDALTTERPYKKAFTSKETFHHILKKGGSYFKMEMAHRFVDEMVMLFKESSYLTIGCYIQLNTNEIAKVVSKDYELTARPCIEIIETSHGKVLDKPIHVDLNLDNTRHIIKIIDYPNNK